MPHRRQQMPRAILTEQQAIEIFGFRSVDSIATMVSGASFVAKRYGINERTVRDIWKQRTWTHATSSLAEAGPMAKMKMGRPVGSKDMRPRKQKLAAGNFVASSSSIALNSGAKMPFYSYRPNSIYQEKSTVSDQIQQDNVTQQLFSSLLLESSNEPDVLGDGSPMLESLKDEQLQAAIFGDRSPIEDEREEEASIDDQLHAWADRGAQWILTASLPLTADSPWACEPSAC